MIEMFIGMLGFYGVIIGTAQAAQFLKGNQI